jgi:hypothetical protein
VRGGAAVELYVDAADEPAVIRAVGDLQADIERVGGVRPKLSHTLPPTGAAGLVLVGTAPARSSTGSRHRGAWTSRG